MRLESLEPSINWNMYRQTMVIITDKNEKKVVPLKGRQLKIEIGTKNKTYKRIFLPPASCLCVIFTPNIRIF